MPYSPLTTFTAKQSITSAIFNAIKDDIDLFRSPPRHFYQRGLTDGNYTTSSTTLADIDATNINASITTTGNPVRVFLRTGRQTMTATAGEINLLVDGLDFASGQPVWRTTTTEIPVIIDIVVNGLSAGVHTFKLQFRITGAGTFALQDDNLIQFEVREL